MELKRRVAWYAAVFAAWAILAVALDYIPLGLLDDLPLWHGRLALAVLLALCAATTVSIAHHFRSPQGVAHALSACALLHGLFLATIAWPVGPSVPPAVYGDLAGAFLMAAVAPAAAAYISWHLLSLRERRVAPATATH